MTTNNRLGVVAVLCCVPVIAFGAAGDAVSVDPTHHHVILNNDHVRVFEVLASPGATSDIHTHPPTVLISLDKARLRVKDPGGETAILDLNPAQSLWMEDAEHAWELVSGRLHVFGIEVKSAQDGKPPAGVDRKATDAVAVDPTHHHVILDNDHVRVFEVLASAGATSEMHTHSPLVIVSLAKTRSRMRAPGQEEFVFDLNPGQVIWTDGMEHSWEVLAGRAHVFAVEIKAAASPGKQAE